MCLTLRFPPPPPFIFWSLRVYTTLVTILSSLSLWHCMFRPNRPSSVVQVVTMKEPAAHCNSSVITTCTRGDGRLGRNMQCQRENNERIVTDVAHRRRKIRSTQCNRMLRFNIIEMYHLYDGSSQILVLVKVNRLSCPYNRPWRPIGLWDVEAPTFSR
jgi:hypothetical protein